MKKHRRIIGISILIVFLAVAFAGSIWAGETMTIVGIVNDDGDIVDQSGQIFEVADNDKAMEVSEKSGAKVEVKGMVEEGDSGLKTITIESYRILE